jgi:hypothetical protein
MTSLERAATSLLRRAFNRTIRTKHTTITFLGFEQSMATAAFIKEQTGVSGHFFFLLKTTFGTGDNRFCCYWNHTFKIKK